MHSGVRCASLAARRLCSSRRRRRWASSSSHAASEKAEAPVILLWTAIPAGFFLYYCFNDLQTIFEMYQTPFNVHDVAADISVVNRKYGTAPLFLRLAWQSSCLYNPKTNTGKLTGCLADPDCVYSKLPCSKGLDRAIALLRPLKEKYPILSWPDLIALAACASVEDLGGPKVTFRYGREEAPLDVDLAELLPACPDAHKGLNHVKNIFFRLGFSRTEAVALMGAHTVGGFHREFSGVEDESWTDTPFIFDNSYFIELQDGEWALGKDPKRPFMYASQGTGRMFPTDVALLSDPDLKHIVHRFAADELGFHDVFTHAFQRLLELGYENKLKATAWKATSLSEI